MQHFCAVGTRLERGYLVVSGLIEKICVFCNKLLERKEHESRPAWEKRKYCDIKCALAGQKRDGHWRNYKSNEIEE